MLCTSTCSSRNLIGSSRWPGSYIRPRVVRVRGYLGFQDLACSASVQVGVIPTSNRYDPLYEGYVSLSERDPDSASDLGEKTASEEPPAAMEVDCRFDWFIRNLTDRDLPGDLHAAGPFDNRADFEFGDPGAHFGGTNKCEYATSGQVGEPHWSKLFQYLLTHFAHVIVLNKNPSLIGQLLRPGGPVDLQCTDLLKSCVISSLFQ